MEICCVANDLWSIYTPWKTSTVQSEKKTYGSLWSIEGWKRVYLKYGPSKSTGSSSTSLIKNGAILGTLFSDTMLISMEIVCEIPNAKRLKTFCRFAIWNAIFDWNLLSFIDFPLLKCQWFCLAIDSPSDEISKQKLPLLPPGENNPTSLAGMRPKMPVIFVENDGGSWGYHGDTWPTKYN